MVVAEASPELDEDPLEFDWAVNVVVEGPPEDAKRIMPYATPATTRTITIMTAIAVFPIALRCDAQRLGTETIAFRAGRIVR